MRLTFAASPSDRAGALAVAVREGGSLEGAALAADRATG